MRDMDRMMGAGSRRDREWREREYMYIATSVKIEIGCRDDTVPKTIETRRHCEEV